MGNMQTGHRKGGAKQGVTVLQGDGRVMEFSRPLRVADLLYAHPGHFVCHSSALVLLQQGKMLPANALLMRGEVYFLLPLPQAQARASSFRKSEKAPLLANAAPREEARTGGTMKFLITKQQLAKILAEGTIKTAAKEPEPSPPSPEKNGNIKSRSLSVLHSPSPTLMKRSVTWSPRLESISEVPVM